MKNFRFFISFISFILVTALGARDIKLKQIDLPPVLCYGNDSNSFTRILPNQNKLKSTTLNHPVEFIPIYGSISEEAKNAFEYALSQWSLYLNSTVPIRIKIDEETLPENVLASAGPSHFYTEYEGLNPDFFYPIALIEKIIRKNLNGEEQDIRVRVSNNQDYWYYGTDGNTPAGKYDFVSTVMHEIGHGLGFIGSMEVNTEDLGEWGFGKGKAIIFDNFVINQSEQYLINESLFLNPSIALKNQFTSNQLYFLSPVSLLNNPEYNNPRLYAPITFDDGSSIYHLNDATYPAGSINSLMTHATGTAEAIHIPGPITENIFAEIGWSQTFIVHTNQKDVEDITDPIRITADLYSDSPSDTGQIIMFYKNRYDAFFDSVTMEPLTDENYYYDLVIDSMNTTIDYYFLSRDRYNKTYKLPYYAPDSLFSFYAGEDLILPELLFDPKLLSFITIDQKLVPFSCEAIDNLGVDSVFVEYSINFSDTLYSFGLIHDSMDVYKGQFNFIGKNLQVGDVIEYYITIIDNSTNKNEATFHNSKMGFPVIESSSVMTVYQNDFSAFKYDFFGAANEISTSDIEFLVSVPSGLSDQCLHTPTPYQSTNGLKSNYDYVAQLRFPIKLSSNAAMKFDEIVLVEPSDFGVSFGENGFWDYVVVEASKDKGSTWFALEDGYDCRKELKWFSRYKSDVDASNNSDAIADPSLYVSHFINILDNPQLKVGDTVLFRFRLYSDQYAYGWGWAIDNLNIQGPNSVKELSLSNIDVNIFPNPIIDELNMDIHLEDPVNFINLKIINVIGTSVSNHKVSIDNLDFHFTLNVSGMKKGIYLLVLETHNNKVIHKFIKY